MFDMYGSASGSVLQSVIPESSGEASGGSLLGGPAGVVVHARMFAQARERAAERPRMRMDTYLAI
jgi:hypothetical protein